MLTGHADAQFSPCKYCRSVSVQAYESTYALNCYSMVVEPI